MANDFWVYEPRSVYNRRMADRFKTEAQKRSLALIAGRQAENYGIMPATLETPVSAFSAKPLLSPQELGKIEPPTTRKPGTGGVLGIFDWSNIDSPADLLRPIARLFEAENRLISKPLARRAYGAVEGAVDATGLTDLPDYENLPAPVQMIMENLLSPTTWIAPGAVLKAAKFAPSLARGIPALGAMAPGLGSRAGLRALLETHVIGASIPGTIAASIAAPYGGALAKELGLPEIVGQGVGGLAGYRLGARGSELPSTYVPQAGDALQMVNPEDMRVYHGTAYVYQGMPSPMLSGRHYNVSAPQVVFFTPDPVLASSVAEDSVWGKEGARVIPAVLKKGVKYWDPDVDAWPAGYDGIRTVYTTGALEEPSGIKAILDWIGMQHDDGTFSDWSRTINGARNQTNFVKALKKRGYQAYKSGQEVAVWDMSAIRPLYDQADVHKYIVGGSGSQNNDLENLRKSTEQATKNLHMPGTIESLKATLAKILRHEPLEPWEKVEEYSSWQPTERPLADQLGDSIEVIRLQRAFKAGTATDLDILQASELLARYDARKSPVQPPKAPDSDVPAAGGAEEPPGILTIMDQLSRVPNPMLRARNVSDAIADNAARNSLTQQGRAWLNDYLDNAPAGSPRGRIAKFIQDRGIRLWDDDATFVINEYQRLSGIAGNQASALTDLSRAIYTRLLDSNVLEHTGASGIEDLMMNLRTERRGPKGHWLPRYDNLMSKEQMNLLLQLHQPVRDVIDTASAFGLDNLPSATTPGGLWVGMQPATESPLQYIPGGRPPTTLPDPVTSRADAAAKGIELREFIDAQQAFFTQMLKASADKWLDAAMEPYARTITELLPSKLLKQQETVKLLSSKVRDFSAELSRAIQTGVYRPVRNIPPQLVPFDAQARAGQKLRKRAERKQAFRDVRTALIPQVQILRSERKRLVAEGALARGTIERAGGTKQFPVFARGKYYPQSAGEQLSELYPKSTNDVVTKFNNIVRPILATLDISGLGIQGLMGLARNPKVYLGSVTAMFSSEAFDSLVASKQGLLDDFIQHDGAWLSRNDLGEFLYPHFMSKLPPANISNLWFTRFGNALRLQLYEASLPLATTEAAKRGLARNVSLATGYSPNPASRLESLTLFAPRYFRSQLGFLSDALTLGPATKSSAFGEVAGGKAPQISRDEARKMLRNLIIGGSALTYAANQLLGEETELDPTSPNFMRIRAGGHDISVFGPWDTLVRAVSNTYRDGFRPDLGLEYLARAKASPAVSRLFDLVYGETFSRDTISFNSRSEMLASMWAMTKQSALPISVQEALQTIERGGDVKEALFGGGLELIGTKTTPLSPRERRDILSQDTYGARWRDLEPYQRVQLERAHPDEALVPARDKDDEALNIRRAVSTRFADRQAELDKLIPPGPDWVEQYNNLRREQTGAFGQWEAEHPDTANNLRAMSNDRKLTPPQQALENYYELFQVAREQDWTPDEVTTAMDRLEDSWTPEQSAYVARNTGLRATPTVLEYRAALKTLRPYFDLEDVVWDRVNDRAGLSEFASLQQFVDFKTKELLDRGIPQEQVRLRIERLPVITSYSKSVQELRFRMRMRNPEIDALVVKWYGLSPARGQER